MAQLLDQYVSTAGWDVSSGESNLGYIRRTALPSVPELHELQGLKPGTVRHAYLALAEEGLVHIRHGRTATIAGEPASVEPGMRLQLTRPRPGHDCKLSGCQLLAGGFDLRNTAARLGHSGGGATTLRHYADPVPEVDRRAAAYLAQLTAGSATQSG